MSNPESLTVSLDLARKLRDAGLPQGESYFVWENIGNDGDEEWKIFPRAYFSKLNSAIDAPMSGELGERLLWDINGYELQLGKVEQRGWWIQYYSEYAVDTLVDFSAPTEQEARGLMYLYLTDNNYLEAGEK